MERAIYANLIFNTLFVIVLSIYFFVIGFRGLFTKKPFLLSSKWTFGLIVLCFLPQILNTFTFLKHMGTSFGVSQIVFFIVFLFLMYRALIMREAYVAYGVTDVSLRDALHYVLKKKNIAFEETLASIKLPSVSAELQVSLQSWIGVGQIRIKENKDNKLFKEIVNDLNIFYKENNSKINMTIFIFYIFMAICMAMLPVLFINLIKHAHHFTGSQLVVPK